MLLYAVSTIGMGHYKSLIHTFQNQQTFKELYLPRSPAIELSSAVLACLVGWTGSADLTAEGERGAAKT